MSQMALELIQQAKAEGWKSLDLGNTGIVGEVPAEIWELTELEELSLSSTWYEWPDGGFTFMQSKNSGPENEISAFPDLPPQLITASQFPGLTRLKKLVLRDTQVTNIQPLAHLNNLQSLSLSGTQIGDIQSLATLSKLQDLDLNWTQIEDIQPLANLSKLQKLSLSGTQVTDIRPLATLSELQSLTLSGTQVADIRPLATLSELQSLALDGTRVIEINPLSILNKLYLLKLSDTEIADIQPLATLSNLLFLSLSHTRVEDIQPLAKIIKLHELHLRNTQISDIQPLANLINLHYLALDNTKVADIQPLAKLSTLQILWLGNTQVADIQPLATLIKSGIEVKEEWQAGKGIIIKNCPLTNPPYEKAIQGNKAILDYWEDIATAANSTPLFEAKMLIVGEGGAGKTSLLRRLRGLDLPKEEESTKGIDIAPLTFATPRTDCMTLNAWDFGGQELYHATHQFFFTKRALYVLVDDTRHDAKTAEDASFKDWLEMIEVLGGDSPVLIFQNEKSGRSKSLDQMGIRKRFPNVDREFFAGDLLDKKAVAKIQAAIEDRAGRLPHVGELWPQESFNLRAELQQLGAETPFITLDDYLARYARHKAANVEKALSFSAYLHDLGVLLHYQDDKLLKDLLILRNSWATAAVYRILDDEAIKGKQGYFTEADCKRLWPDADYQGKHMQLRQLMIKFELCYALRDCVEETWLAPQLLPQTAPDHGFVPAPDDLVLQYHYDLMPKGMISRLMVRMNRHIRNPGRAWRNGALFQSREGSVLVEVPYAKKEIHFRARGTDGRTLLAILADDLEALNGTFEGLKNRVDKMVPCKCPACAVDTAPHLYKYEVLREQKHYGIDTVRCERRPFATQPISELLDGVPASQAAPENMRGDLREGSLQIVRIFLASSQELELDRKEFELFINRENKHWIEQGLFLRLEIWEGFFDALDASGLQKAYNQTIRECDLFVSLFHTRVGPYTREEFEAAVGAFRANGRPLVWTYFNQTPVKPSEMLKGAESILDFQDLLKRLGHYKTTYANIDDLKHQFSNQLRKVLPELMDSRR